MSSMRPVRRDGVPCGVHNQISRLNTGLLEKERMDVLARRAFLEGLLGSKTMTTKTNLYQLIEAIQDEGGSPEDDGLVVSVVSHLLSTGKIRVPISGDLGEEYSHAEILGT